MIAFFLLTSGVLTVSELFLVTHGIMISLLPCYVFYATGAWGWKRGIAVAVILGLISDLVMGNYFPFRVFLFSLIACCACWSVKKIRGAHFFDLVLPGALIPLLIWLIPSVFYPFTAFLEIMLFILPACLVNALVLPLTVQILDGLAEKFNLKRFADAGESRDGEEIS